jgi:hypothetical protein
MAAPQQVSIKIPEKHQDKTSNPEKRRSLALDIIVFMINRTLDGTGTRKQGRGFSNYSLGSKPYTKEYAEKKGVGRSDVDLTLSSEMLNSIQFFPSKSNKGELVVGFKAGTRVNAKAEGNQLGSYGRSPDRNKARPFLGITRDDLLTLF